MSTFNISQMYDHWLSNRYGGERCAGEAPLFFCSMISSIQFTVKCSTKATEIPTIITQYTIYRMYTCNERVGCVAVMEFRAAPFEIYSANGDVNSHISFCLPIEFNALVLNICLQPRTRSTDPSSCT